MRTYPSIGIQIPTVLLPKPGTDLFRWAVIACDQFTSEPEYWQQVEDIVGGAPSTLNMVLPEVFLGTNQESGRIQATQARMQEYLGQDLFTPYDGIILVERTTGGMKRHGLMLALDLECYDFQKGSQSLIRATEGTILDRLPPRIRIRQGAHLELPHILVLIDDPDRTVIEPLFELRDQAKGLYDFDLMLDSGHLRGDILAGEAVENQLVAALEKLADPKAFQQRYETDKDHGVLLFAMGDGNHSFATARSIWEQIRSTVGMNHPARYALVEIENVHDHGLVFEPIHRVVFDTQEKILPALQRYFGEHVQWTQLDSFEAVTTAVDHPENHGHTIGLVSPDGFGIIRVDHPKSNLPVGTLQAFLDDWLKNGGAAKIDYVHGHNTVLRLGTQPGNLGFYLPAMDKSDLFKTVILDSALPRKTFSMGDAKDKRFYLECRKIVE